MINAIRQILIKTRIEDLSAHTASFLDIQMNALQETSENIQVNQRNIPRSVDISRNFLVSTLFHN